MNEEDYCLAQNMSNLHLILHLLRGLHIDEEFGITDDEKRQIGVRVGQLSQRVDAIVTGFPLPVELEMPRVKIITHHDCDLDKCPIADQKLSLEEDVKRLSAWVTELQSGMFVNCVYCGHNYGPQDEVEGTMGDALKEHVEQCPEHPMARQGIMMEGQHQKEMAALREYVRALEDDNAEMAKELNRKPKLTKPNLEKIKEEVRICEDVKENQWRWEGRIRGIHFHGVPGPSHPVSKEMALFLETFHPSKVFDILSEREEFRLSAQKREEEFQAILSSEHELSNSYVRIRELVGAIEGAPKTSTERMRFTETKVAQLVERLGKSEKEKQNV